MHCAVRISPTALLYQGHMQTSNAWDPWVDYGKLHPDFQSPMTREGWSYAGQSSGIRPLATPVISCWTYFGTEMRFSIISPFLESMAHR